MTTETIQDWIQGFESHISRRFNKSYSIIALEGGAIIDIESVCKIVCHLSGVSLGALKSNIRQYEIVSARHIAMSLSYKYLGNSLKEIGQHFGKDHTAVIHARKSVQDKLDIEDRTITTLYNEADALINKLINEKITQ